jgi:hypothetical protein
MSAELSEKKEKKLSKQIVKTAIRKYKSSASIDSKINLHYKKHKTCEGLNNREKQVCEVLYKFLSENQLEKDEIVYRGVSNKLPLREYISTKDGQPSNIFMSTSRSQLIAKAFAKNHSKNEENPYIFKILLPKGTHAVDLDSREDAVSNIHEEETLVLPGGILRFTGEIEEDDEIPVIHFIYDESSFSFMPRKKKKSLKKSKKKKKSLKKRSVNKRK